MMLVQSPRLFYLAIFNLVLLSSNLYLISQKPGPVIIRIQDDSQPGQKGRQPLESSHVDNLSNDDRILDPYVGQLDGQEAAIGQTGSNSRATTAAPIDFELLRQNYLIPSISTPSLVNCAKILANDTAELARAKSLTAKQPKEPVPEETYLEWTTDCQNYKITRGFITIPLSQEEQDYPLAFSISMYTDIEHVERLLRAIYQPQNIYCIHIDVKSSLLLHRTMQALVNCFDNVFIASHLRKIKWGDVSVLLPDIECMRDLVTHHRGKWKYYINLTGQEFPLRSNYELVRVAKIFNGANDIAGSKSRMEMERVRYYWKHRWSKTYQQTIFYNTYKPKSPPPFKLTFYKGELHGLFSRKMVEYIMEDERAQTYLEWCWDSGHPSEHYWNTLNYNPALDAPGGYTGPLDVADAYSYNPIIRAKHWQDQNYGTRECKGKLVRGICIYGLGDLPWLSDRKELFANKFHLTFESLAYDCMEEKHRNRTMLKDKVPFDEQFYQNLPTVKYGRKDGL